MEGTNFLLLMILLTLAGATWVDIMLGWVLLIAIAVAYEVFRHRAERKHEEQREQQYLGRAYRDRMDHLGRIEPTMRDK